MGIVAKHFKRGEPETEELQMQARAIRRAWSAEQDNIDADLKEGTLYDLVNGEVELVLPDGRDFRLYLVQFVGDDIPRLVIDDYHPDEDAQITTDEYGVILDTEHPDLVDMELQMRDLEVE